MNVAQRIRRLRYVAYHQVEDNGRMHWRDWIEVEVFENADLRQLGAHGRMPGLHFQLRVPMIDPETGNSRDADGDLALLRIAMVGATLDLITGTPTVKGFIAKSELAYEDAYRQRDLQGCIDAHDAPDYEYVVEEWQVLS